jgi:hypothetical protein
MAGLGLCLLAKGERRYPDKTRGARMIAFWTGIVLILLAALHFLVRRGLMESLPTINKDGIWNVLRTPLPAVVISIIACTYANSIATRAHFRLLAKISQVPLYPAAAGTVAWIFGLDRLFWPLRSIILDWAFTLSMLGMIVITVTVLLRCAREATLNWVSDP